MFIEILRYLIYSKDTCADSLTFIYPIYFSYKNNSTHFAIEKYNSENPEIFNHTAKKQVQENPNEFQTCRSSNMQFFAMKYNAKNSVFTNLHICIRNMSS